LKYLKKRVAVAAVWCQQFSGQFPVKQGIYREYSRFWALLMHSNTLKASVLLAFRGKFPMLRNREFIWPNRD
jgi:hypothetical protein